MNYKAFGRTGIKVSELIFGTWYLPNNTAEGKRIVNKEESIKIIQKAYDLGINFFDTADVYRGVYERDTSSINFENIGLAERIVGEALRGYDRESFIISTKVMGRTGPLQNDMGVNRKHINHAIKKSLERLQMHYIDFYILHAPDNITGVEEAARSMNRLIDQGLIYHYGLSNFSSHELMKFINLDYLESPKFIQDKYNLIEREQEERNIKVAEENSLASMIYSPLAQGILAGRYFSKDTDNARANYEKFFKGNDLLNKNIKALEEFRNLSLNKGVSMAQLSLSWLINKGKFIFPIIGATKIDQLEDNVKATEIKITKEEMETIEKIFKK
ncbi:MAG: aldo/keto reductase [Thermoplasmata archaeon]